MEKWTSKHMLPSGSSLQRQGPGTAAGALGGTERGDACPSRRPGPPEPETAETPPRFASAVSGVFLTSSRKAGNQFSRGK